MRVEPLTPAIEGSFLKFLRRDVIANYFALLDLKFYRGQTKFWIALEDAKIEGYLLEYYGKNLCLRGGTRYVAELLRRATLAKSSVNIEPAHLQTIRRFYEPIGSISTSRSKIATLLAMKADKKSFWLVIKHDTRKLGAGEFDDYEKIYREMVPGPVTRERITETLNKRITYGVYERDRLVSFASGSITENVSHIGPVYTPPRSRGRGYSTSACSVLVRELLSQRDMAILFVPEDNIPALRVYEKIGFTKTGHKFLAFWGRKIA